MARERDSAGCLIEQEVLRTGACGPRPDVCGAERFDRFRRDCSTVRVEHGEIPVEVAHFGIFVGSGWWWFWTVRVRVVPYYS
jgi:hypothetical protein